MILINTVKAKGLLIATLAVPLLIAAMGINGVQFVHAQTSTTSGDFSAKGYTGQILVLPAGMTSQLPKSGQATSPPPVGTIIGGTGVLLFGAETSRASNGMQHATT
jgi:hypothetical protein